MHLAEGCRQPGSTYWMGAKVPGEIQRNLSIRRIYPIRLRTQAILMVAELGRSFGMICRAAVIRKPTSPRFLTPEMQQDRLLGQGQLSASTLKMSRDPGQQVSGSPSPRASKSRKASRPWPLDNNSTDPIRQRTDVPRRACDNSGGMTDSRSREQGRCF